MSELYKNIRDRRIALNLSQDELAKKVGYTSRSTIAKIEVGENDIPQFKIVAFAEALETTPAELMGWGEGHEEEDRMSLIVDAIEIIESEGFSVHSYDNENGIGNEYVVEKRGLDAIPPMQEWEFVDRCEKVVAWKNDDDLESAIRLIFKFKSPTNEKTPQSSDQGDLLDTSSATMDLGTDDKGYGLLTVGDPRSC